MLNPHPVVAVRKQRPATLSCRSPKGRTRGRREQVMGTTVCHVQLFRSQIRIQLCFQSSLFAAQGPGKPR